LNQKELKDILKDNQDMLFYVSPDGTVVIWGVQVSIPVKVNLFS